MSGECDLCGEHTLDCTCIKNFSYITNRQIFMILMRELNDIAIKMPRKESEKVLYIIRKLEQLEYFPNKIIIKLVFDD